MGIQDAFKTSADFNDLVANSGAHVGGVVHKAFLEVNEEGSEAAAATGMYSMCLFYNYNMFYILAAVVFRYKSIRSPPMDFNVNHPFAYVIRDAENIYFQGHFVNPEL